MREQSAAVRVNDATVSRSDFEDQLDLVYENDDLREYVFGPATREQLRAEGDPRGSYTQQFAGGLAGLHVQFLVVAQLLEDQGVEISDDDLEAAEAELDRRVEGGADSLSEATREAFVEGFAVSQRLQTEFAQDEWQPLLTEALADATIEVNTRYGTWDADRLTVTPPEGPAPPPGADVAPTFG